MTKDTSKLAIWEALGKTDPKHTKPFKRSGGFSGTAIKPIWAVKQMTEFFGPSGSGWGMKEPVFQVVPVPDAGEILVYCTVEMWYSSEGIARSVYGVGGDKVVSQIFMKDSQNQRIPDKEKGGFKTYPQTDDEAFKKAFTDALGNAMKYIGVGADVHMGQFEDSKYVQEVRQEFEEQKKAEVVAEVERQKGSQAPQDAPQAILPPELDWQYQRASDVLICRIVEAQKRIAKDKREFVALVINNKLDETHPNKPMLFYWHNTHRDLLLGGKDKVIKVVISQRIDKKGPIFTIESLLEFDGKVIDTPKELPPVAGIKPVEDGAKMLESTMIQARLLASNLNMTEDQLMHNVMLCKGSWQGALEFLQREQARREVTA